MQINVLQNQGTEQNCGLQHKIIQNTVFKTDLTRQHGPLTSRWISHCPIGSVPLEPQKTNQKTKLIKGYLQNQFIQTLSK